MLLHRHSIHSITEHFIVVVTWTETPLFCLLTDSYENLCIREVNLFLLPPVMFNVYIRTIGYFVDTMTCFILVIMGDGRNIIASSAGTHGGKGIGVIRRNSGDVVLLMLCII